MTSPAGNHSFERAHVDSIEEESDGQDCATWLIAKNVYNDGLNLARAPPIDRQPQILVPPSPRAALYRPASFENRSQHSSVEFVEDKSQNPAPKQPGWWSRLISDSWIIELVAGFVSFAAIASIVGVLWAYDQKPVPPLKKGITLNAIISFLATISRTAIMLCISTVLSQGKWLWFKKERSLIDLQNIEVASRGPLGSIFMLFSFRGGAVPYLAAFLTVATLGFDTFVQQLLITENRVVPVAAKGIGISSTTSMTDNIYGAMTYQETFVGLTAAMLANVQQRPASRKRSGATIQALASPLKADCPSGNCCRTTTEELAIKNLSPNSSNLTSTISAAQGGKLSDPGQQVSNFTWEIIPKVGRRWQVASNLSTWVSERDKNGGLESLDVLASIVRKVVWPLNFASSNGMQLNTSGWTEQSFAGIDEPVAAIGFAKFDIDDNGLPVLNNSLECAVTYCIREYNTSVIQDNLVSNVLSTHYGKITGNPNMSRLSWSAEVNGTSFTANSSGTYGLGIGTLTGYVMGSTTYGYESLCNKWTNWNCSLEHWDTGTVEALSTDAWQGIDLTSNFTAVLENANTFTSQILQQYGNKYVIGDNAVTKTFVVVRWAWITLPAAIVFFGVASFGFLVWETSRMQAPSWKASLLPLIYRYAHLHYSSAEGRSNTVAAGLATARLPQLDCWLTGSSRLSEFQVQAEVTTTRFTKAIPELQVWQLQSLGIVHEDKEHW